MYADKGTGYGVRLYLYFMNIPFVHHSPFSINNNKKYIQLHFKSTKIRYPWENHVMEFLWFLIHIFHIIISSPQAFFRS